MAIQHSDITDPQIHEPKGASTAAQNTVYVANGAGTGAWMKPGLDQIDTVTLYADVQSELDNGGLGVTGRFFVTARLDDISTAGSVIIPLIQDCTVVGASFVLGAAITTADAVVNVKNSSGATMGSPVTILNSSSSKGDQYAFTATGNNAIIGPSWMEIETDGASDNTAPLYITVELEYVANANI